MLKSLNVPIAQCVAEHTKKSFFDDADDDQLECEVLLCPGERVMLTCNLCVEAGLVNGALGWVQNIFYMLGSRPPELPMYTTFFFISTLVLLLTTKIQDLFL